VVVPSAHVVVIAAVVAVAVIVAVLVFAVAVVCVDTGVNNGDGRQGG